MCCPQSCVCRIVLRLARSSRERVDRGEYRLVRRPARPNEGLVDWLLACPEKDFFVPIASESTDTL